MKILQILKKEWVISMMQITKEYNDGTVVMTVEYYGTQKYDFHICDWLGNEYVPPRCNYSDFESDAADIVDEIEAKALRVV
jgi:hypothetical protein